jgi:hypothetical protein
MSYKCCLLDFDYVTMALVLTDSISNRHEYQEYFLGVKATGAYCWQHYHLHVPIVLKSENLKLLEPSGLVQACSGTALKLFDYVRFKYNLFSNILSSFFFHVFVVHNSSLLQYHAVSTGKQLRSFRIIGVFPSPLSSNLFFWSTTISRNVGKYLPIDMA